MSDADFGGMSWLKEALNNDVDYKFGDSGSEDLSVIRDALKHIYDKGINSNFSKESIDWEQARGSFGPRMKDMVEKFQNASGIKPANGTIGPKTKAAIAEDLGIELGRDMNRGIQEAIDGIKSDNMPKEEKPAAPKAPTYRSEEMIAATNQEKGGIA